MDKVFTNPIFIKIILNYACKSNVVELHKRYSINDAFHETISIYGDYSYIMPDNKKILKKVPWLKDAVEKNVYKSLNFRKNYMEAIHEFKKAWLSMIINIDLKKTRGTCSIYWSGNACCKKSKSLRDKNKINFCITNISNREIELFCKHVYEIKEMMINDMLRICETF